MSYNLEVHSDDSVLIHLDSRDANNYLDTNLNTGEPITSYFQYILTDKLLCPDNQVMLVSLYNASIPYSFYNVRLGINDKIDMKLESLAGGGIATEIFTITIPPANYTAFSLADEVKSVLNAYILSPSNFTATFDMRYNDDTQKYDYTIVPNTGSIKLSFLFNTGVNQGKTLRIETGFNQEDKELVSGTTLTSTNCIDINGSIHGVYIRTNLTSKSVLDSQNGNLSNILARVPIQIQAGGIIFFNSRDGLHHSLVNQKDITILTIRLTDERNRQLDLNGLHFQLGIKIDFMYDKKKKPPLTKEQRRVVGITDQQKEEQALENILLKESENQRDKLLKLLESGEGEVVDEGDTMIIRKRKKPVGRPRKVGRPTFKEIKRRVKENQDDETETINEKMLKASKTLKDDAGFNLL